MEKRLKEIEARLAEIKGQVESADIEQAKALDAEVKALTDERAALQKKVEEAEALNKKNLIDERGKKMEDKNLEYRKAFMEYVLRGKKIPAELRGDAHTTTSNAGTVIPVILVNQIMAKLEALGDIYNAVTKTSYKGGVTLPFVGAIPTAAWVAERAAGDKSAIEVSPISFAYHKLKVTVACSLEITNLSIEAFEAFIVDAIAKAMIKALETAIVAGAGTESGQPQGFATVTPATGQAVDGTPVYADLCKAEGVLPAGYDGTASYVMNKKTFWQVMAEVDDNGQPVARVNFGINGKPEYRLLGRRVYFSDALPAYADSLTDDTVWACLVDLSRYMLNLSYGITIKSYEDNDTDDTCTKAVALADGKFPDVNAIVTLKK